MLVFYVGDDFELSLSSLDVEASKGFRREAPLSFAVRCSLGHTTCTGLTVTGW
jgi:hypothetical protein